MIDYNGDKKEVIKIITKFCQIIVNFFIRKNIFSEEQREIYQYGFELWVSSAIGILMVLAIGIISGKFWESVVFYIVFCSIRLFSGGFHLYSLIIVCRFAPVENHNKKLTKHEKVRSKIISIVEMMICPFVMLLFNSLNSELDHIVALTLFFVANLMLLGIIYERRKKE